MEAMKLVQGGETIMLDGSDALSVVRGGRLMVGESGSGADDLVWAAVELDMQGAPADLASAQESLGRLCERSMLAQPPVYLVCQPSAVESEQRSRVVRGWVESLGSGSRARGGRARGGRARGGQGLRLVLLRENAWEGPLTQAPLSNRNGSNTTTALPVFNCDDGAAEGLLLRCNWVEIGASVVGGDLPARARLEITNRNLVRLNDVWLGHNFTDPVGAVQVYEAEDALGETGTEDAGCSGGRRVNKSLVSGVETELLRWTVSGAALKAARGQPLHALVRFAAAGWEINTRFRLAVLRGVTRVWRSELVQMRTDRALLIRDLWSLRLPAESVGVSGGSLADLALVLSGLQDSGDSHDLHFDFLALVPADGWRYLTCNGYGVAQDGRMIDDGLEGEVYADDGSGGQRSAVVVGHGQQLALRPGLRQRLVFYSHTISTNSAPVNFELGVKVFFRPRRRAL